MLKLLVLGSCAALCAADLRLASQPNNGFKVKQRQTVKFVDSYAVYMEPSDFQYNGLKKQRDNGAYDNFLRSNIDNEQDRRNFDKEPGLDMLPFRSYENAFDDSHTSVKNKLPKSGTAPPSAITATPDTPVTVPLRWNNPHASELEVNVWIGKYVVPIRKPTCSGEGYQDNVFSFTIPTDFNFIGSQIPNFKGCLKVGDCVLQVYAHSVESRTYAIGIPLIVTDYDPKLHPTTATNGNNVPAAQKDPGADLSKMTKARDICLPSSDPTADIKQAKARQARLISDVYNHAYQNSDYSPYSGQQPEAISKNLQASCILKMVTGNRGELGRALLRKNSTVYNFQQDIEKRAKKLIVKYEAVTNAIIAALGPKMETTNTVPPVKGASQQLATCFRCQEVGSLGTKRIKTNTYIPSFQIESRYVAQEKAKIPKEYHGLISDSGVVGIYAAVLDDMSALFDKAARYYGLSYLPPMIKTTQTTMFDVTQFRKVDANGKGDKGVYAATEAKKKQTAAVPSATVQKTPLSAQNEYEELPSTGVEDPYVQTAAEMDSLLGDAGACDDDSVENPPDPCPEPQLMFSPAESLDASSASTLATTWAFTVCAVVLALLF